MKFLKRFFCGLLAGISLFTCGCDILKRFIPDKRDLTVKSAPCTVQEIWNWNEELVKEFFDMRMLIRYGKARVKCTVNGEEWEIVRQIQEDLSVGVYEVRFYTEKGFTLPMTRWVDGEMVEEDVPYEKDLTLTVYISNEYGDIYDFEYREENGLWTTPMQEEWYQDLIEEQKKKEKVYKNG